MEENVKHPEEAGLGEGEAAKKEGTKQPRVRDLFAWKSANRAVQQYPKEVFGTFGAIALLISIILLFFQEWLAIVVTWAALFLFYMLTKMEPVEVEHKITTEGVVSMGHSYLWGELGPFWFSRKGETLTLHIAHRSILGQLMILVDEQDKEKILDILADFLPYIETPERSPVEKMADWFAKTFPILPKAKQPPAETKAEPEKAEPEAKPEPEPAEEVLPPATPLSS